MGEKENQAVPAKLRRLIESRFPRIVCPRPHLLVADDDQALVEHIPACWSLSLRGPGHSHPGLRAEPCR